MAIWKDLSTPPDWAKKPIAAGRLKGKTDINPMWRYEAMTFQFGPCGEGWKYTIDKLWKEDANDGCVIVFALVTLYIKNGDNWSEGIPGIGGNQMVQIEKTGLHANDECYKMAVTDALSVACKVIGVGADIYKGLSDSKHGVTPLSEPQPQQGDDDDKPWLNENMPAFQKAKESIASGKKTIKDIRKVYKVSRKIAELLDHIVEDTNIIYDDGLPF